MKTKQDRAALQKARWGKNHKQIRKSFLRTYRPKKAARA